MAQVICTIFDRELAKELGKKENESDLEFYHRKLGDTLLTFVCPVGFPEKPGSLLQALHLSNCILLQVREIDSALGETIIAIEALNLKKGFVIFEEGADEDLFWKIAEKSSVKDFEKIEKGEILEKISSVEVVPSSGKTIVDLDAMFKVKGVGTVALGFVKQGRVEQFQKLRVVPKEAEVLVKTIQKQDKHFKEAEFNERVGLSIKGFEADDFYRGLVLTDDEEVSEANEVEIEFKKNEFCKKEIGAGASLHIQCRMQIVGCRVKSVKPFVIEAGKNMAIKQGSKISLVDLNASPRIIGKGKVSKIVSKLEA